MRNQQPQNNTAAIGCGSIILIGLMIFFVGRWSHAPVQEEVETLTVQVQDLHTKVDGLRAELAELRVEVRTAISITGRSPD